MWRGESLTDLDVLKKRATSHLRDVSYGHRAQSSMAPQEAGKHVPQRNSSQIHRRIVPCGVVKTLRDIESMSEVFRHLADVVRGVALFDFCGWECFNISVEDVLVVEEKFQGSDQSYTVEKRVKISDLDYAKRLGDGQLPPAAICTSTNCFISTEVEGHRYQYWKDAIAEMEDSDTDDEDWMLGPRTPPRPATKEKPREAKLPPFRHNILHDGESVFWLALYLLLTVCVLARRGEDGALVAHGVDAGHQEEQRAFAQKLFARPGCRFHFMRTDGTLLRHVSSLDPRVQRVLRSLDEMRKQIVQTYTVAESKLHRSPHSFVFDDRTWNPRRLLKTMAARFAQISKGLEDDDILMLTEPGARQSFE
ncbi:hypothetical protein PsYK624_120590 [Phanerochaete sordida]|uniref:Fungal-type protein kinase domain-containing protein n=1 Tax=Phanerochaete sordida TaxID=48140 RepID=A0A9P3GH36_9APHY|nr:hypothetical protein PsYK624_120590 [Phanerochaete sordida]